MSALLSKRYKCCFPDHGKAKASNVGYSSKFHRELVLEYLPPHPLCDWSPSQRNPRTELVQEEQGRPLTKSFCNQIHLVHEH